MGVKSLVSLCATFFFFCCGFLENYSPPLSPAWMQERKHRKIVQLNNLWGFMQHSNFIFLSQQRIQVQSAHYENYKHHFVCWFMVVQGHLWPAKLWARLRANWVGASAMGSARAEPCQPSCGPFPLLSSWTWVSGRWESIFISGVLPADCDPSINASAGWISPLLSSPGPVSPFIGVFFCRGGGLMQPHFPNTNKAEWKVPLKALVLGVKSRNSVELSASWDSALLCQGVWWTGRDRWQWG